MIRYAAAAVLAAATAGQTVSPPVELRHKLEQRVAAIAAGVDGVLGYAILDLTTGERLGHLDGETFPTASSIKLAVVHELFKQAEERTIALDERLPLDRSKAVGGSGVLQQLGTPTLSIRDYATLMVMLSDNTATNVLIDRLGMENINRRLRTEGLVATRLRRHMMDAAAARRGDENVSSPAELVRLLEIINATQPEAVDLLKKPKESRLRRGLPAGVETADKPGELEGVRVDAGVVFVKNRPYIICVMATFLKNDAEGEHAIEEISRAAYDYFSRLGAGRELGRRIGA